MFVDVFKSFDSILKRKMEQILLANSLPNETVRTTMMFYKDTKAMVHLSEDDYYDIVAGVLEIDKFISHEDHLV